MEKQIFYYQNKIHYRVIGSGTAVLLVHGFGEDGLLWDEMVAALSDKFQFIAPDLPGSGKSDAIEDMTMEGLAEILEAIIQNENINKAVVIGHSMGGYISLAYAEKYIHRIQAFGLFHSTAFADSDEKPKKEPEIFEPIEIAASFTGNWVKFLEQNLIAETPVSNGAPAGRYSVIIKFTIDENGNIIAADALTHHGYGMEQEAIRVIKKANSKWQAPVQNGYKQKAIMKQVITFVVQDEE